LRSVLGDEAFSSCWEEGRKLTLEQATALALGAQEAFAPR
jgi:hypothetical protein